MYQCITSPNLDKTYPFPNHPAAQFLGKHDICLWQFGTTQVGSQEPGRWPKLFGGVCIFQQLIPWKGKKTTWSQQLGFMLVLASSFCLTNWHDISNLEKTTVNVCKCDLIFNLIVLLLADWHLSFLLKGLENNHCISPHPVQWSIFPS